MTGDGIQVRDEAVSFIISDNQIYAGDNGIFVEGIDTRINGNLMSGGVRGIQLANTASRTGIAGNTIENVQYGINLSAAQDTHVTGNIFGNISTAALQNSGGTGTIVQGNLGLSTVGTSSFITVGASPFTHTTGIFGECVSIFGGTVSNISVGGNTVKASSDCQLNLPSNTSVVVTYTSVPFMTRIFQ